MKKFLIVTLFLGAVGITRSLAQPQDAAGKRLFFDSDLLLAERDIESGKGREEWLNTFQRAVGDKILTGSIAWRAKSSSYDRRDAQALEILQNQKIIEQNEQIIKLLTSLNKKK